MSKALADMTVRLALDAKFLAEWNKGATAKERDDNRTAIMKKLGLTERDIKAVLNHDNDHINAALSKGVKMRVESWINSTNSIIKINAID
ncbi:hypothetical protein [Permianibacter aggregans]|uniref:Uncharacterized protein n=1 Tax=Permianibacter aggregans TaxID=1510150 RepID=A0A4R6V5A7_9GAMM|nr:hypothetical protein [Permianibacter aggregans]QGX41561.1 hypothetical protein E2H98_18565 [Permianibacter aggregans]TDQ51364.1 hypothetical protein EV696_101338 [Permianibacter aggregans]